MTTDTLVMVCDKVSATRQLRGQRPSTLQSLPYFPTLQQFNTGPFLQPLYTSLTTGPLSTFHKARQDVNSLLMAVILLFQHPGGCHLPLPEKVGSYYLYDLPTH